MKQNVTYNRSTRSIRAAYIARNCPKAWAAAKPKNDSSALGGISFGGILIGLFLLLLL